MLEPPSEARWSFHSSALPDALRWIARPDLQLLGRRRDLAHASLPRDQWVRVSAAGAGYDARAYSVAAAELPRLLRARRHLLLALRHDPDGRLMLLKGAGRNLVVLTDPRDGSTARRSASELIESVLNHAARAFSADLDSVLQRLPAPRGRRARSRILVTILGGEPIADVWLLEPAAPRRGFWSQLVALRLPRQSLGFAVAYLASAACFVLAWTLVGRSTLLGRIDPGYLLGALLLFASSILLRALSSRRSMAVTLACSTALKRWLLEGALKVDLDLLRSKGSTQLLSLVLESAELETLALDGALLGFLAVLEIVLAIAVLAASPIGWVAGAWLGLLLLATIASSRRLAQRQRDWTQAKTELTGEIIEGIVGHRTRLAQCPEELWHEREAEQLEAYRRASCRLDQASWWTRSVLGRVGLLGGLVTLAPAIVSGAGATELAAALGAILLAHGAIERFADALLRLLAAKVSYDRVRALFDAAGAEADTLPPAPRAEGGDGPLLEARDLCFRFPNGERDILSTVSLSVHAGDRVLIEAPSGGGKSTLLSLLSGLRSPSAGQIYSRGIQPARLGIAEWRSRIAGIPQFHSNHVFSGTLAFNCLIGSAWPARPADVTAAERVLTELGLGRLLEAMPAGMEQAVGETGWRLSHGEQARLLLARGVLRAPDVLLIDESFGALDPDTTLLCLGYLQRTARSIVLVAHR